MERTAQPRPILLLACIAGLGLAAMSAPQDPELTERVRRVEEAQTKSAKALLDAEAKIAALEAAQARNEAWFRGLPAAAQRLEAGLAQVFAQGFTRAGVNYTARETLLDTLKQFGQDLSKDAPKGKDQATER